MSSPQIVINVDENHHRDVEMEDGDEVEITETIEVVAENGYEDQKEGIVEPPLSFLE